MAGRRTPTQRRSVPYAVAMALLSMITCGEPESPAKISDLRTLDGAVTYATANLQPNAGAHEIAASLVWFMATGFERTEYLADHDVESMLRDRKLDPLGAGILLERLLTQLGINHEVILFTEVPDFGLYPLVDVKDEDGDHVWDPFAATFAPDHDGLPASLTDTFAAGGFLTVPPGAKKLAPSDVLDRFVALVARAGAAPRDLELLPRHRIKAEQATILVHAVDFTANGVALAWGTDDGSSRDVWSGSLGNAQTLVRTVPYAGDTHEPFGPSVFAHQFCLSHLVPGEFIALHLTLVTGLPETLLVSASDATLTTSLDSQNRASLQFTAAATQATITVGAADHQRIELDALQWSRP